MTLKYTVIHYTQPTDSTKYFVLKLDSTKMYYITSQHNMITFQTQSFRGPIIASFSLNDNVWDVHEYKTLNRYFIKESFTKTKFSTNKTVFAWHSIPTKQFFMGCLKYPEKNCEAYLDLEIVQNEVCKVYVLDNVVELDQILMSGIVLGISNYLKSLVINKRQLFCSF
ncbi:hypothetical protein HK103_007624 [Boothiomyces macroporosus]|uniref:Uncharacterized protein n=1 Tax=Boothiomyces macroporosus TaxID=261099 RepID=A0AAD5Y1B8_9FUNG|nr:hypothetical protein HK103_007624 [Boothiomyces macroporosus]